MMADLLQNVYAKGSDEGRQSMWRAWCDFHHGWFRDSSFLPLTSASILGVAACFRNSTYRKFGNYATVAKHKHLDDGNEWSLNLELRMGRATRAVARGLGPDRQAARYDMMIVAVFLGTVTEPKKTVTSGGPTWPVHLLLICGFFLLREIEAAAAKFKDIVYDAGARTMAWTLPVSKTDTTGKGCARSWSCVCLPDKDYTMCPVCFTPTFTGRLWRNTGFQA
mgnify:CR=1 FL=1